LLLIYLLALQETEQVAEDSDPEEWLTSTTSDYFPSSNTSNYSRGGRGRGRSRGGGNKKVSFVMCILLF
jgi:hypothetical protein